MPSYPFGPIIGHQQRKGYKMQYFFNDMAVTETEYNEQIANSKVDVPKTFHMIKEPVLAVAAVKMRKPVKVVTGAPVKEMPSKLLDLGISKIDQACSIVAEFKDTLTKDQLITQLQLKLNGITRSNAAIYLAKALIRTQK